MATIRIKGPLCEILFFIPFLYSTVFPQAARIPSFANWYQQVSAVDGFKADFPSKPTLSVEDKNFPNFNTKFNRYADTSHKGYSFEVGHAVYPPVINDKQILFDTAASAFSTMFSKLNAEIQYRRNIKLGNCSGEEIFVTTKGGLPVKIRMFMSGQDFYQLTTGSDFPGRANVEIIDYFLDSFSITGGCNDRIAPVTALSNEIKHSILDGTLDSATGWRKIVSVRDGLELLMPNAAKVDEEDVSMGLALTNRTLLSTRGTATYYVNVTGDFPPGFVKTTETQIVLDLIEKNLATMLAPIHPKITLLRNLKLGSYSGREYSVTTEAGRQGRAQIFMTAKKRYLIIVSDSSENYSQTNVDRFLGSIRISTN